MGTSHNKKTNEEIEIAKRAKEDKKKDKKKKKKREEAKRAVELVELDSPTETSSDEESSDDNSGPAPSLRVNLVSDNQNPSNLRAVKRAMEYLNSCSDI